MEKSIEQEKEPGMAQDRKQETEQSKKQNGERETEQAAGQNAMTADGLDFAQSLIRTFGLLQKDWKMFSPLTLAYIGDAAYELVIRSIFVAQGNCQPQKLHHQVTALVSARHQAKMAAALQTEFTEEEAAIFRRGRNSKPYTRAKNATLQEYLDATGLEAVLGFLYLTQRFDRMNELIAAGLKGELPEGKRPGEECLIEKKS